MKKSFFILVLGMLSCTFCAFAYTDLNASFFECKMEKTNIAQQSRVYVQPEQIHVNLEGIFVEIARTLYQVSQICQDEHGFFVPHAEFWWKCPNGHPNPPWRLSCQVCGMGPA